MRGHSPRFDVTPATPPSRTSAASRSPVSPAQLCPRSSRRASNARSVQPADSGVTTFIVPVCAGASRARASRFSAE